MEIRSMDELDKAEKASFEKPVVLFKDSVTCGISASAKHRLFDLEITDDFQFYYLDLLSFRNVSNEIANRYGVIHQSPQVIVLRNGKTVYDTSHHAINSETLSNQLK